MIKLTELIYEWVQGKAEDNFHRTAEIWINPTRISSMKNEKLMGKDCVGIILDHNAMYVTETVDEIIDLILRSSCFGVGEKDDENL